MEYAMYQDTFFLESAFQIISSSLVLLKFDSVRAQMQEETVHISNYK